MVEIVPNWHPIWVHFAIALLVTGTGLYVAFGWKTSPRPTEPTHALVVARWMLWLGAIAALTSLLTGYWASTSVAHDDLGHANMIVHRNWAMGATAIFAAGAGWEFMRRNVNHASVLSALLFLAGGAALLVTGLEGAENVYEHGLGVERLPEVSDHDHAHADPDTGKSAPTDSDADGHAHDHTTSDAHPVPPIEKTDPEHPAAEVAASMSRAIGSGDTDQLKQLLAEDVVIFESGNVESSLAEYESHHMKSDMAFMAAVDVELLSRKVIDAGDSATVISRSRINGEYRNKEIDLISTETLVVRKRNGGWKVVHVHWSSN